MDKVNNKQIIQHRNSTTPLANNEGFAMLGILVAVTALTAGILATSEISKVIKNADITTKSTQTKQTMNMVRDYLINNARDIDSNGQPDVLKEDSGNALPAAIPFNGNDMFGTAYKYCTWHIGPGNNGNASYSQNNAAPPKTGIIAKLISAGSDKTFQTTCDDVNSLGDDIVYEVFNTSTTFVNNGWTAGAGNVFVTGMSDLVGMGTNTPASKLTIYNTANNSDAQQQIRIGVAANQDYTIGRMTASGLLKFAGSEAANAGYLFEANGIERLKVTGTTGNIQMGDPGTDTGERLQVAGIIKTTDGTKIGKFGSDVITAGAIGIGSTTNHPLVLGANNTEVMRINPDSTVQISKTNSSINFSDSTLSALNLANPTGSQTTLAFTHGSTVNANIRATTSGNLVINSRTGNVYLSPDSGATPRLVTAADDLRLPGTIGIGVAAGTWGLNVATNANIGASLHIGGVLLSDANRNVSANAVNSTNGYGVLDTRNVNDTPGAFGQAVAYQFKNNTVIGNGGNGMYSGVMTVTPWADDSGGGAHQIAYSQDGNIYRRYGTRAGGWQTWRRQIDSNDISGTAGYIPKFISPTQIGNSSLYDNGTNVLVGVTTSSTASLLEANGAIATTRPGATTQYMSLYADGTGSNVNASASSGQINFKINNTHYANINTTGLYVAGGISVGQAYAGSVLGQSSASLTIFNSDSNAFGRNTDLNFNQGSPSTANRLATISGIYNRYAGGVGGALAFSTSPGAGTVVERMRVTEDGSLLLGSTAPVTGAKLEVTGGISATGGATIIGGGGSGQTLAGLYTTANGASAGFAALRFGNASSTDKWQIQYNNSDAALNVYNFGTSTNIVTYTTAGLAVTGAISATAPISVTQNATMGGNNSFNAYSNGYAYLIGNTNGLIIANNATGNTRIKLGTDNNITFETNSIESMRVDSNGNILLGTSSTPLGGSIRQVINGTSRNGLQLTNNNNGGVAFVPTAGGGLSLYTHTGAVGSESYSGTPQLAIDSNGLLGIGTTTPGAPLHVSKNNTWTANGWQRNAIFGSAGNSPAIQFGYGGGTRWGMGNAGGHLYMFTTAADDTSSPATYRAIYLSTGDVYLGGNAGATPTLIAYGAGGVGVTGNLTATSWISSGTTGTAGTFILNRSSDGANTVALGLSGNDFVGNNGAGGHWYYNVSGNTVADMYAGGMTVTGDLTVYGPSHRYTFIQSTSPNAQLEYTFIANGVNKGGIGYDSGSRGEHLFVSSAGDILLSTAGTNRATVNSNGLAVTGEVYPSGGLRVQSAYGDNTNGSPWYGIGITNLTLTGAGGKSVQVGGYWGVNFATAGGNMAMFHDGTVTMNTLSPDGSGNKLQVNGGISIFQPSTGRNNSVVGTYDPTRLAQIWSMGTPFQIGATGTPGNLYGLSYSYEPDYGGAGNNSGAIAGLGHQMQWRTGGATCVAIGQGGVYSSTNIYANGTISLANNSAYRSGDSSGTQRRMALWSPSNAIYFGDIDNTVGSSVLLMARSNIYGYVNGSAITTVDSTGLTVNGGLIVSSSISTSGNLTGAEVYTNGWYRNNVSGKGLYNAANDNHIYSESTNYWAMTTGAAGAGGLKFYSNGTSLRGYVYSDASGFGLLHSAGGWGIRITSAATVLYNTVYLPNDNWITSTGDSTGRLYFASSGHTYIKTANSVIWQNSGGTQTMSLDASGNLTVTGNISTTGTITGSKVYGAVYN